MPPPPLAPAVLPRKVQLFTASVPELYRPPPKLLLPETALPSAIVRPLRVTVRPAKTRKARLAWLPLRVRLAAPGPVMVTLRVRFRAPPVSVRVWGPVGRPNWMVSLLPRVPETCARSAVLRPLVLPLLTTPTASRRLRVPSVCEVSSARVLTVSTAGASRCSSASSRGTPRRPGGRGLRTGARRGPPDFRLI